MREISKMCYNPVEEDVVRAKNQLKAAILFSQDNLSGEWSLKLLPASLIPLKAYLHDSHACCMQQANLKPNFTARP